MEVQIGQCNLPVWIAGSASLALDRVRLGAGQI